MRGKIFLRDMNNESWEAPPLKRIRCIHSAAPEGVSRQKLTSGEFRLKS